MHVSNEDFFSALKEIEPSSLREVTIEVPNVKWEEVGNLEDVKKELIETVELPVNNPEVFERMGFKPSRGILFYGPPRDWKDITGKGRSYREPGKFHLHKRTRSHEQVGWRVGEGGKRDFQEGKTECPHNRLS